MRNHRDSTLPSGPGLARNMPLSLQVSECPEGAIIPDAEAEEDRIAVIYDCRKTPPEITVTDTEANVQTVLANGVAVAIVACADGPRLTADDILLVERFV